MKLLGPSSGAFTSLGLAFLLARVCARHLATETRKTFRSLRVTRGVSGEIATGDIREGFLEVGPFHLQEVSEDDDRWPGGGGEEKAVPGSESSEAKG